MQDDFNKWCDLWDKAQAEGIFKDASKLPVPTPQTSDQSFFGPIDTHHDGNGIRDCDTQYWNDVYELSKGGDPQLLQEGVKDVLKTSADAIVRSPNPITPSSVGTDQELTPGSMGATFSEKDIEDLTAMKLQLHELTSKMASYDMKNNKQLEAKLVAMKKKIDEFSDELSRSLGEKKSNQGQGIEVAPML